MSNHPAGSFVLCVPAARRSFGYGYYVQENGCWISTDIYPPHGYGVWYVGNYKRVRAHRWMYEQHNGSVPRGLTIDHLCRNRGCVNPDHLEAVTNRENILRGTSPAAQCAAKAVCSRGHLFDEKNTYHWRGQRHCRICWRIRARKPNTKPRKPPYE